VIVAHLADLHLGYEAFERSERGRNVRERDIAVAFQRAVKGIVRAAPDLILIVGDVFDRPDPPPGAFLALGRGLETLRAALPHATVLMVGGARDVGPSPGQPGPLAAMDAFPNVESADSTARSVHIAALDTRVLLLPYPTLREPPMPALQRDPKARWNILALPARIGPEGPEIPVDQWDYVALGTAHVGTRYSDRVHDPGSLERIDPDPWDGIDSPKGFLVVDLERQTVVRHPVEGRPTVALARVQVDRLSAPGALSGKVSEVAKEVPGGLDGRVVRLPLSGAGIVALQELEAGVLGALRERALHLDVRPGVLDPGPGGGEGLVDGGTPTLAPPETPGPLPALDAVHWPDGFRLLRPEFGRERADGLTALVWEGRAALKRALFAEGEERALEEPEEGNQDAEGTGVAETLPLRMCWTRPGTRKLEGFAEACARALAELGGIHQIGEEIRGLGFPAPVEDPSEREARLAEIESEFAAARVRLSALATVDGESEDSEGDEQRLRGEAAEAIGDAEAAVMEWLRERQDAETTLHAFRDRAREMKRRITDLESEAGDAPCPTCGRPLAEHYEKAAANLREEYDGIVQDGRWWRRRWEQLAEKAPEVQKKEGVVVRLHAELEEAGERVHRARLGLREQDELRAREALLLRRGAFLKGEPSIPDDPELDRAIGLRRDWLEGMAAARERLAERAGSYIVEITSGRYPGFGVAEDGSIRPIGMTAGDPSPGGAAAAFLALELAFAELASVASDGRVVTPGMLLAGTLDALAPDARVRAGALLSRRCAVNGPISVLLTPSTFGATREFFTRALELLREGGTRALPSGSATIRLRVS